MLYVVEYHLYKFPEINAILLLTFDHVLDDFVLQHLPNLRQNKSNLIKWKTFSYYHQDLFRQHVVLEILDDVFRHHPFWLWFLSNKFNTYFTRSIPFNWKLWIMKKHVSTSIVINFIYLLIFFLLLWIKEN
jgi:hypothetical protein